MILLLHSFITIIFLCFLFFKKNLNFGFKESFLIGLFFYTYVPISINIYFEDFLIKSFIKFVGFNTEDIIKTQYLIIMLLASFFAGYFSINKKIKLTNIKKNFTLDEILIVMLLFSITTIFRVQHINSIVILFVLSCLIINKMETSNKKKILYYIIFALLFQYISSIWSVSRRDIIKILFILFFFISTLINNKKIIYYLFTFFVFISIIFVFSNTYNRTDGAEFEFYIPLNQFIANYDFMPAFENLIYIIGNDNYLEDKTLFKVFYSFIPRDLWTQKPIDTNLLIVAARENSFVGGTSAAVTFLGEVYWNYGKTGTVLVFFLFGVIAKNIDLCVKDKLSDIQLILYPTLTYLGFLLWRGSISTTIIIYLINIFSLIAVILIVESILRMISRYSPDNNNPK